MAQPQNLLEPEYADAYSTWSADPTPENTSTMINKLSPVMDKAMTTYAGYNSPSLRGQAKLLTINSLGQYDPSKAKLRTHLMTQLQSLRRFARKEQNIVQVPERVAIERHNVHQSTERLRDRFGREPSDMELADESGLSTKRLKYIRQASRPVAEGAFESRVFASTGDLFQPEVAQTRQVAADDDPWVHLIYSELNPTDRLIMEYSLGLGGKRVVSNQAMANKLGLTPAAVSQRKARIQTQLDSRASLLGS